MKRQENDNVATLEVAIADPAWLAAPGRSFPIAIDPTWTQTTYPGQGGLATMVIDGEGICAAGHNPKQPGEKHGTCRGGRAARAAGGAAQATGRWVDDNRWQIAGYKLSAVCLAATAGGCAAAAGAYLSVKTYSTARSGGSWGDHAYNVTSTVAWTAPGLVAARYRLVGKGGAVLLDSPNLICSAAEACASPGIPDL